MPVAVAVTRALQVGDGVADQSAAEPADQDARRRGPGRPRTDGRERQRCRRLLGRSRRAGRPPRRAPPRRDPDLPGGAEHRRGPHQVRARCPTRTSSSSTTAARTAPPTCRALGAELGGSRSAPAGERGARVRLPRRLRIGLERGFDVLVEMDADLSHDPAALPALLAAVDDGADLAIGPLRPRRLDPDLAAAPSAAVPVGQPLRGGAPQARRERLHRGLPRRPCCVLKRSTSTRSGPTATGSRSR